MWCLCQAGDALPDSPAERSLQRSPRGPLPGAGRGVAVSVLFGAKWIQFLIPRRCPETLGPHHGPLWQPVSVSARAVCRVSIKGLCDADSTTQSVQSHVLFTCDCDQQDQLAHVVYTTTALKKHCLLLLQGSHIAVSMSSKLLRMMWS
jgi:hypothetical protein